MRIRYLILAVLAVARISSAVDADEQFAAHLFDNSNYQWAQLEYTRLLFAYPDSNAAPAWHFKRGVCLKNLGRYESSITEFDAAWSLDTWADSARLLAAESALRLHNPDLASSVLAPCRLDHAKVLLGYIALKNRDYPGAREKLKMIPVSSTATFKARALEKVVAEAASTRKKHYIPALTLSLLPGLGHVYTGRLGDAAMTALTVSTGAFITGYYAYHQSRVRAWTTGTITGLFYAGGMYGAAVSVHLYNTRAGREWQIQADRIVFDQ